MTLDRAKIILNKHGMNISDKEVSEGLELLETLVSIVVRNSLYKIMPKELNSNLLNEIQFGK
jgi:hypothetical protein